MNPTRTAVISKKRRAWRIAGIALFLSSITIAPALYAGSVFYRHLARFDDAVKREDEPRARKELLYLEWFYGQTKKFKLDWAARRLLFRDSLLYEAHHQYLTGDYERAEKTVESSNDYRAFHLRGNAKFREAQGAFAQGAKKDAVFALLQEAQNDYKEAVERGPSTNFDDKWNYDLVSEILNGNLPPQALVRVKVPKPQLGFAKPQKGAQPKKEDGHRVNNQKLPSQGNTPKRRG